MNGTSVAIGVVAIAVSIALAAWGMFEKVAYENCLEMMRAFDRGESAITPQCRSDQSSKFFLFAIPAAIIGIVSLVTGIRGASLFPSLTR